MSVRSHKLANFGGATWAAEMTDRFDRPLDAVRRSWQRRIEVYSPKPHRRLTLFSPAAQQVQDMTVKIEAGPRTYTVLVYSDERRSGPHQAGDRYRPAADMTVTLRGRANYGECIRSSTRPT